MGVFDLFNSKRIKMTLGDMQYYTKAMHPHEYDEYETAILSGKTSLKILKSQLQAWEEKIEELDAWEIDFNTVTTLRSSAVQLEKEGKPEEALFRYLTAIDTAVKSKALHFGNFSHDIERVIIIYGKLRQKEKLVEFLKLNIEKYPSYSAEWKIRLAKLQNTKSSKIDVDKSSITLPSKSSKTLGDKINAIKAKYPEFDFYSRIDPSDETAKYSFLMSLNKQCYNIRQQLSLALKEADKIIDQAKLAESESRYKDAIDLYEKLIVEEIENPLPYSRLIIIYRKLKWQDDEARILKSGVDFFSKLRDRQKKYVLDLASKYRQLDKALEYIDNYKKVHYYGGAFELYNPYPIVSKWEERLKKIT